MQESQKKLEEIVGKEQADLLKEKTLRIYEKAFAYAKARGILIADTKIEFGWKDDEMVIVDELLTPDSSRFWSAKEYKPGGPQPSLDKQYVRDYLTQVGWRGTGPPPKLPEKIIVDTSKKYRDAYKKLVGLDL